MANLTPTPHIGAKYGEIAERVIMAGDPLRAKFMAERYLENPKLVNQVRGMYCYTGTYKGKEVSVMGHGMGISSIGIYTFELYNFCTIAHILPTISPSLYAKNSATSQSLYEQFFFGLNIFISSILIG